MDPTVKALSGAKYYGAGLQISHFTPAANPTNAAGLKAVKITADANSPIRAFKAVLSDGESNCATTDYTFAKELTVNENFTFNADVAGTYKVCAIGKTDYGTWQSTDEAATSSVLTVDTFAPNASVNSVQGNEFNGSLNISVTFDKPIRSVPITAWKVANANIVSVIQTGSVYSIVLMPVAQGAVAFEVDRALVLDAAGNALNAATQMTKIFDSIAPSNPKILLNGGQTFTSSLLTSVSVSADGDPARMYLTSVAGCISGGAWAPFSPTVQFSLLNSNSVNSLFAKFSDVAGNESPCVSASISHNDSAPSATMVANPAKEFVNSAFVVTTVLSQPIPGFTSAKFVLANATISNFSIVANTASMTVTPISNGPVSVTLPVGSLVAAGGASSLAAFSVATTADFTPPSSVGAITLGPVPSSLRQTPAITYSPISGNPEWQSQIIRMTDSTVASPWTSGLGSRGGTVTGINLNPSELYKIQIRAVDKAGNAGPTSEKTWTTAIQPYRLVARAGLTSPDGPVNTIVIQPDNKVIIAGSFVTHAKMNEFKAYATRLDLQGNFDSGFLQSTGFNGMVKKSWALPGGKVLVIGSFTTLDGASAPGIARLNADGTKDVQFNVGSGFNSTISSAEPQPDGKIIVAGVFTSYMGMAVRQIVRLNGDGSLDPTFHANSLSGADVCTSIKVQSNGKLVVAGSFASTAGQGLIRLLPDGSPDASFIVSSFAGSSLDHFLVQADDRLIVLKTTASTSSIYRLVANGDVDASFGTINIPTTGNFVDLVLQTNGQLVVAGNFTSVAGFARSGLARFNGDGSLDLTFNPGLGLVRKIAVTAAGGIIAAGSFTDTRGLLRERIVLLGANGAVDPTYDGTQIFNGEILTVTEMTSAKIFIGGSFSTHAASDMPSLARLNADQSLDTSYDTTLYTASNSIATIALQSNGKLVVGGTRLNRLNADGTKDTSFSSPPISAISSMFVQPDDKIVVVYSQQYLDRFNSDGTRDLTFTAGRITSGMFKDIALQPDGKIVVVGRFTNFKGVTTNRILRLHPGGSLDTDFAETVGAGFNEDASKVSLDSYGNIFVAGTYFSAFNGVTVQKLVKLTSSGSLDTNFSNAAVIRTVNGVVPTANGLIYVIGGVASGGIVRLDTSGNPDPLFSVGGGISGANCLAVFPDGRLAAGGFITNYDGNEIRNFSILAPP